MNNLTLIALLFVVPLVHASELPEFPPDNPAQWVCKRPEVSSAQQQQWCAANTDRGQPANLPLPNPSASLEEKNRYDITLRDFLRSYKYRELGWLSDQRWRMTGPYVGDFGSGQSYGVHPAVRVWYSPEMLNWMCADRVGDIPVGAMVIKEMHSIDKTLGVDPNEECISIDKDPAQIDPGSWTVMVRTGDATADGWYWANPTATGDGNPPLYDKSAVTQPDFFKGASKPNPNWYPTGDLFGQFDHQASIVTPYNEFGGLCINCHASAESGNTFSSLSNLITDGLQYRHYREPKEPNSMLMSGAAHHDVEPAKTAKPDWGFSHPKDSVSDQFLSFYDAIEEQSFADALALRLPAETWDHVTARGGDNPGLFITSDQCIGCHDATVSNAGTPNMLVPKPGANDTSLNVSPYAEWRASPMGLAGRDPIFFAQLQSETNNLPQLAECIENTCLHCHGVMGQRSQAADTQTPDAKCKNLFVDPPADVPFGQPFRLSEVSHWNYADGPTTRYGRLARDGISCTVCHRISEDKLAEPERFTGNFGTTTANEIFGPFEEVLTKPMEHALGIEPVKADQISDSALCSSCHNILLPVLSNSGEPIVVGNIDGQPLSHSFEQTTGLEWTNSVFSGSDFQSCQDCHMPGAWHGEKLPPQRIANIESNRFAPTDHRLPDNEITLEPRSEYKRHALHGLNIFLNQMFQEFPIILGVRQIDYAGSVLPSTQPALVTGAESMLRMAQYETADVAISKITTDSDALLVDLEVTNKVGHYLPSGVGFRRVFIEVIAYAGEDIVWASGRTNALGAIVDGASDNVLITEFGNNDSTQFQPHYQEITAQDQVQIYQELVKDSAGILTTSFLRRAKTVKDNRLRPRGFDVETYEKNSYPYVQLLAEEIRGLPSFQDPDYSDPARTGSDQVRYRMELESGQLSSVTHVTARLLNQSIPPFFLQQRFNDANEGPKDNNEIRRLYYLTSRLNTEPEAAIADWKLVLTKDCKTVTGQHCP